jgi:class 3 adenylate cyclase/alpha-beta hydrolase superfamily lysophospholipase
MNDLEYARADDGTHIAYRVLDAGPGCDPGDDIVMASGGLIPMEVYEEDPGFVRLLEGLRGIGRVVVFDRRGIGLSDPIVDWERPILDQWADDLAAVVGASEVTEPTVISWDGYGVATRFAVRHPELLRMLVLYHPQLPSDDDGWDEWVAARLAMMRENVAGRQADVIEHVAPSRATDASFRDWYARAGRMGASPATASRIWDSIFSSCPRDQLLDEVATPTLVLHRRDAYWAQAEDVRATAARISTSTIVELDGADHFPFLGDVDGLVAEVANFVVGERRLPPPQRLLSAIMFTDLVGSTERAASLGDARWKSVLDRHDAAVRAAVGAHGGTIIKTTGDGVLALMPSTSAALRAAERIRRLLGADDLDVRIGVHVGDVDRRGDDVSGLGVVVAARVMAVGEAGEIIVTASVVSAITGEGAVFEPLGAHQLKGVPGKWELYRVAGN